MTFKTLAFLFVLLLAGRISVTAQTSASCPVSFVLVKLTEDRFTVKVSGHSAKPRSDKALLWLTLETVDDQNVKHLDSAHTIAIGTYSQTGPWNSVNVRHGKLILRIQKSKRAGIEPWVPVDGCQTLERPFDFSPSTPALSTPTRKD